MSVQVLRQSGSSCVFAFLPAGHHPTSSLTENGRRLSGGPARLHRSPSLYRCFLSRSWTGSSPGDAAEARCSKIKVLLKKECAYLLFQCYNLHKAFPLVLCGCQRFHYNTFGLCLPFLTFLRICSFIAIDKIRPKMNAILRCWKIRSLDLLPDAIQKALSCVSPRDCSHWFTTSDYC